ncbi:hypothetical protein L227DRAFT_561479 [Lentinus tigrinus ALCF2SS1-6]|uniref:Uncharacterized protein n=1 Tax=Lentinus tigrinus ALCF2SS1-6 TaxID=1328759 RepID=A0A5C2SI04_9APHY|nr:hypothetical protein L227DRAFT_561479 [Lentinus tigrinus ALCF2SS1-6]
MTYIWGGGVHDEIKGGGGGGGCAGASTGGCDEGVDVVRYVPTDMQETRMSKKADRAHEQLDISEPATVSAKTSAKAVVALADGVGDGGGCDMSGVGTGQAA